MFTCLCIFVYVVVFSFGVSVGVLSYDDDDDDDDVNMHIHTEGGYTYTLHVAWRGCFYLFIFFFGQRIIIKKKRILISKMKRINGKT